uniref:Uncharacterized protein n=1 Tax=Romanomermis culicivorax TaxID=13658 RepID=A0A915KIX9_ROMCU
MLRYLGAVTTFAIVHHRNKTSKRMLDFGYFFLFYIPRLFARHSTLIIYDNLRIDRFSAFTSACRIAGLCDESVPWLIVYPQVLYPAFAVQIGSHTKYDLVLRNKPSGTEVASSGGE